MSNDYDSKPHHNVISLELLNHGLESDIIPYPKRLEELRESYLDRRDTLCFACSS